MSTELTSDIELCEKAEPFLEKDDASGLVEAFENGSLEKHPWLLYPAIHARAWNCLRAMWDAGIEEDCSDYDHKDYPHIFDLIFDGQSALACEWLDRGYYIEMFGGREQIRILHAAAERGQHDVIKKLICLGADVNAEDYDGHTPLWYAAKTYYTECARLLLDAGAWPDGREKNDDMPFNTPLSVASCDDMVKLLLEYGANPEIPDYSGRHSVSERMEKQFKMWDESLSPLTKAAVEDRPTAVWELLKAGLSPDCQEGQPLRWMAAESRKDKNRGRLVKKLVEAGANPDGMPGKEPLLIAALAGNDKVCKALLENGATPLPEALSLAAESGSLSCVKILLAHGIGDVAKAARIAASKGKKEVMFHLLGRFPQINRGQLLHGLIESCNFPLAVEFIRQGADVNERDENGLTPLGKLFTLVRREATWKLVEKKPGIYDEDDNELSDWRYQPRPDNWSELLDKFEERVMEMARVLLDKGADIHARDKAGRSVVWHAANEIWHKSVPWLVSLGASLDNRDNDGISAFEAGCLTGHYTILDAMLATGYDINTQDENGDTALIKTAQGDRRKLAGFRSLLLQAGANPDLKNSTGVSYRDLAEEDKHLALELKRAER